MMSIEQLEIIIVGILVAIACGLPGVFLVLRGMSLMSDAISHSVLLGIVAMFFVVGSIHSPWLLVGAVVVGLLTVISTELLVKSKRMKEDAAIGVVFPVFFSLAVLLINIFARDIHLDQDAVLLGEIALAPFDRWEINGRDLGPISFWILGLVVMVNSLFIGFFYQSLKVATFDALFSTMIGISSRRIHYILMALVSITAVASFQSVGSILVVSFMITPPVTAYVLTRRLSSMIYLTVLFGVLSAIFGYGFAYLLDASIAGSMAVMSGFFLVAAILFSPTQGLIMQWRLHKHQKIQFACSMLTIQLFSHENTDQEHIENTFTNLISHMNWSIPFAEKVTQHAIYHGYVLKKDDQLRLTDLGREIAKNSFTMS